MVNMCANIHKYSMNKTLKISIWQFRMYRELKATAACIWGRE